MLAYETKAHLDSSTYKTCEKYAGRTLEHRKKIEQKVVKFYPAQLVRSEADGRRAISRASYSNDVVVWMALDLFRHWFSSALLEKLNHVAPDGGYWMYNTMARGIETYLGQEDLHQFHERFPMSTKGQTVMRSHLGDIKRAVGGIVGPLLKNESQLDLEKHEVKYLTCAKPKRTDAPWLKEAKDLDMEG